MAIVHRRVQLLVGHLDRSGLFGGGSTVAWGGSGDLVRLHLVVCGLEVGRHIVGVGQVSRKGQGSAGENASTGRAQQATKQAGPGRDRSTWARITLHTWQRRGCAGGPDSRTRGTRSSVRIRATRRGGQGREAGTGTGVASRRQARGARVSQAIENASKTMACNVNSVLQVTGKGAQNKARLAVRLLTRAGFSRAQPETRAGVYAFHAKRQVLCPPYDP